MKGNELTENLGKQSLPSTVKDPFKKNCVTDITVNFRDFWGDGNWKANGVVEFKNGNTKGEQKFTGSDFNDVVFQIKNFLNELK